MWMTSSELQPARSSAYKCTVPVLSIFFGCSNLNPIESFVSGLQSHKKKEKNPYLSLQGPFVFLGLRKLVTMDSDFKSTARREREFSSTKPAAKMMKAKTSGSGRCEPLPHPTKYTGISSHRNGVSWGMCQQQMVEEWTYMIYCTGNIMEIYNGK